MSRTSAQAHPHPPGNQLHPHPPGPQLHPHPPGPQLHPYPPGPQLHPHPPGTHCPNRSDCRNHCSRQGRERKGRWHPIAGASQHMVS
ncbi:MAG: hypothetical protein EA363_11070 [Balneolaceae bacterium]|nr:MAG: hypothetical protein EA363_11070 [Balneolaceae bacterium]